MCNIRKDWYSQLTVPSRQSGRRRSVALCCTSRWHRSQKVLHLSFMQVKPIRRSLAVQGNVGSLCQGCGDNKYTCQAASTDRPASCRQCGAMLPRYSGLSYSSDYRLIAFCLYNISSYINSHLTPPVVQTAVPPKQQYRHSLARGGVEFRPERAP